MSPHQRLYCPVQTTLMYQINIVMLECMYLQSVLPVKGSPWILLPLLLAQLLSLVPQYLNLMIL